MTATPTATTPQTPTGPAYRVEDGYSLIELELRDVRDLFNTLDPAPFKRKDLDVDAEDYIVGAMQDLRRRKRVKMHVYLPQRELAAAQSQGLAAAVHNYFAYRALRSAQDLRELLMRGVISLVIAFFFISLCISLRQVIDGIVTGRIAIMLREGLLILGWVAMWRPIEIFLYDWWPIRRQQRNFRRIAELPIELLATKQEEMPGG